MGEIEQRIRNKLQTAFSPLYLEVENESYKHNVPKASETHFKVST
jgi:BolA protein